MPAYMSWGLCCLATLLIQQQTSFDFNFRKIRFIQLPLQRIKQTGRTFLML